MYNYITAYALLSQYENFIKSAFKSNL